MKAELTFPVFYFDSNSCFGEIHTQDRVEWLIEGIMNGTSQRSREEAIEYILAAKHADHPEARKLPDDPKARALTIGIEKIGQIPSFGYRIEHVGGSFTLGDWLRTRGDLDQLFPEERQAH